MDPLIVTALERGLAAAQGYLASAKQAREDNASALLDYLDAARSVITGLEEEVDEILSEAKSVALFEWERRPRLYDRIDLFLNRDRLRPLLAQVIRGTGSCLKAVQQDPMRLAPNEEAREAVRHIRWMKTKLSKYMEGLSGEGGFGHVHYAGSSGIQVMELTQIQALITDMESDEASRREAIRSLAEEAQQGRIREGFTVVADLRALSQDIAGAFGVQSWK